MMDTRTRLGFMALLTTGALVFTGCSSQKETTLAEELEITATTSAPPVFEAQEVETIVAPSIYEPAEDPGLNLSYKIQTTGYNNAGGGTVVYVLVRNLNDVPVPVDTLHAQLSVSGTAVNPLDAGTENLDLPLGAHAATNLQFAFDTATGNLWDAAFTIGNVRFEGNLASL